MKTLEFTWQRLVSEGQTCMRCGDTGEAVRSAVETLTEVLRPLGIEPVLHTVEIDESSFAASPTESNRILIAGRTLEAWVGAATGSSRCASVCGENECRTVEVHGVAFESVPEWLIVKAGLLAAAQCQEEPVPCSDGGSSASCSEHTCDGSIDSPSTRRAAPVC
jgi:hypothetical protein